MTPLVIWHHRAFEKILANVNLYKGFHCLVDNRKLKTASLLSVCMYVYIVPYWNEHLVPCCIHACIYRHYRNHPMYCILL